MRPAGITVSVIAHAALLAWGFVSLPRAKPLDTSQIEQIPVDFVEMADETKLNKGIQTAALVQDLPSPPPAKKIVEDAPPLPKPDPVPDPTPAPPSPPPPPPPPLPEPPAPDPAPPPEAAPPAPAEVTPPPEPKPESEAPPPPTAAPKVAAKDVPIPRARPSKPKPKVTPPDTQKSDLDQIQALLDKRKLEQMASAEPTEEEKPTVGAPTASSVGKMTANELDALRARLAECWTPPLGWTDPSEVRVVLVINFNQDGSVNGVPSVVESPQGQYSTTAPESALRAVRRCAPYTLPADKFAEWQQVKVTFDPKDMGGA